MAAQTAPTPTNAATATTTTTTAAQTSAAPAQSQRDGTAASPGRAATEYCYRVDADAVVIAPAVAPEPGPELGTSRILNSRESERSSTFDRRGLGFMRKPVHDVQAPVVWGAQHATGAADARARLVDELAAAVARAPPDTNSFEHALPAGCVSTAAELVHVLRALRARAPDVDCTARARDGAGIFSPNSAGVLTVERGCLASAARTRIDDALLFARPSRRVLEAERSSTYWTTRGVALGLALALLLQLAYACASQLTAALRPLMLCTLAACAGLKLVCLCLRSERRQHKQLLCARLETPALVAWADGVLAQHMGPA